MTMNPSMVTATNTLSQLQYKVDTISNNIANINTVGYKRRDATFQQLLTQQLNHQPHDQKEMGRITPYGLRMGYGAKIGQTIKHMDQGSLQMTGRPLDIAIEGENVFYRVSRTWFDDDGVEQQETLYTRNGSFQLQPNPETGELDLLTSQGLPLMDEYTGMRISFPEDYERFEMRPDGTILVYDAYSDDPIMDYQISTARVNRPDMLEGVGESLFRLEGEEQQQVVDGTVTRFDVFDEKPFSLKQGALEMSNVNLSDEMTELIMSQRMMQFQSRSITIADEMMSLANSIRR